jgi:hypothetical protein
MLGLLPADRVRAQDVHTLKTVAPTQLDFWQRTRARLELGISGRSDSASSLWIWSGVASLEHAFSHGWGVGADWGFFLVSEVPQPSAAALWATGPGDPWLKVWSDRAPSPEDRLRVYAGMTIPAAWLPRDATRRSLYRSAYAFGAGSRGLWNAWLWAPEQMSVAAGATWFHTLSKQVRVGVDATLGGGLSLVRGADDVGTLYAQLAPTLELVGERLVLGTRLQAVMTDTREDRLQLSAQSYLRFGQATWTLEISGLCNLDEPLGFVGAGLSICGAYLAVGVRP